MYLYIILTSISTDVNQQDMKATQFLLKKKRASKNVNNSYDRHKNIVTGNARV